LAFTSAITTTLKIPHEPGVTVTIRKLSHHQLMMAADAKTDRVTDKAARLGSTIAHLPDPKPEDRARQEADPSNKYDRMVVLKAGVTGWSYAEACDEGHLSDLDEETASWLFGELIGFSVRGQSEGEESAGASQSSMDSTASADGRES